MQKYSKLSEFAHRLSINNKWMLEEAKICGCFYCCSIFPYTEITEWIEDSVDKTALCPVCQIDSVIPKHNKYPLTVDFLTFMYKHWF